MRTVPRRLLALVPGLIGVVLCVHFSMTLAYLLPLNPVTLRTTALVERYMTPWFAQSWTFFAPNPINETRSLLVACRLRQPAGATVETAWVDVSAPVWAAQAQQRFSAAAWLARLQAHVIQLSTDQEGLLDAAQRRRLAAEAAAAPQLDGLSAAEDTRRALAAHLRARLGAAYCDQWYGTGQTIATRVAVAVLRFPRFSQRHLPDRAGELQVYPFAWADYAPVAPLAGQP